MQVHTNRYKLQRISHLPSLNIGCIQNIRALRLIYDLKMQLQLQHKTNRVTR